MSVDIERPGVSEDMAAVLERLDAVERRLGELDARLGEMTAAVGGVVHATGCAPRVSSGSAAGRLYAAWRVEEVERERQREIRKARQAVERLQGGPR